MFSIAAVRALVRDFADLAGYEGSLILVTFNKARFDRACARFRLEPVDDEDFGESIVGGRIPMVWVNAEKNRSVMRMADTAAHEALHIARPNMAHGPAFDAGVRALLRGREP